jgi:hypothetical protein
VPAWQQRPANAPALPQGIAANDLFVAEFPPPRFVVDGLLGDGLTVLGGKPKGGKSWLALLLAWAIAAGESVDGRTVWQGEVLYLALEDTQRRLQSRLRKLHADLGWVVPETLTLQTAWPRVDDGGLYGIAEWLESRKGGAGGPKVEPVISNLVVTRHRQRPHVSQRGRSRRQRCRRGCSQRARIHGSRRKLIQIPTSRVRRRSR